MPVIEEVVSTPAESNVTTIDVSPKAAPPSPEVANPETPVAPPPAPEPPKPEEDPRFASRFAALSRKEKELMNKQQSLKETMAQAEAYKKAVESARKNPLELLKAAGYKDLEDYLGNVINGEPEPDPFRQKVDTIEQKIAAYEKDIQEQAQRQHEARKQNELNSILGDISKFVEANPDKYEATKAYNGISDVWNLIQRVHIETKGQVLLTTEQAADEVEKYYLEVAEEDRQRLARVKKLQAKQEQTKENVTKPSLDNTVQVQHKPDASEWKEPVANNEWSVPPTLTNNNNSLPQPNSSAQPLSREERLRKAAAKLSWRDD